MEEIKNRIDELETMMFMLEMKDHWSREDFEISRNWHNEMMTLKKELAKAEG